MDDLTTAGGAGGVGVILGAIASFFGFKARINALEKKLDKMGESVAYNDTCKVKHDGLEIRLGIQETMLTEIRKDIKTLLTKK